MNSSIQKCKKRPRPLPKSGEFFIEYRKEGFGGFFLSKHHYKTFEEAQLERERLLGSGATEALIKKIS
jgi:hypothetical protein